MTYDEKQMAAVLVTCVVCQRPWYMTRPQVVCLACQRAAQQAERTRKDLEA